MDQTKNWNPEHEQILKTLEKEVSILRELLSNLFQEEVFLSKNEPSKIFLIHEDRLKLLHTLHTLRMQRQKATRRLQPPHQPLLDLESLLPANHENTPQVLSLRQQIHSLLSKMNDQKEKNLYLHNLSLFKHQYPALAPSKKKSTTQTLEHNE